MTAGRLATGRQSKSRGTPRHSAPIFAALGDATRLDLVTRLSRGGPQSITSLTRNTTRTRQAITKHLRVLEDAGLVRSARIGRENRWRLERDRLDIAYRYLDLISERWDSALERLRARVESDPD